MILHHLLPLANFSKHSRRIRDYGQIAAAFVLPVAEILNSLSLSFSRFSSLIFVRRPEYFGLRIWTD